MNGLLMALQSILTGWLMLLTGERKFLTASESVWTDWLSEHFA